jgi:RHS repeat-associated protein
MTDGNGVIGEEATYTAFGEKVCSLPGGDCTNTTDHRYGYAGAYGYQSTINDTTGVADFPFLHVGVRYYDPASGRFLQRDPIGIPGGLNVYEYVGNSPADSVDPTGNYRHRSFRLSNTGRLRYGCSHIRGKPANVSSNAFRILNKPWHIRGVAGAGLIAASCLLAGAGGAAAGRAIDNAVGRANGGFSISDGLADILFRWWNNDPDYDPSGGGGSGG